MDCGIAGLRFVDLMYFLASRGCGLVLSQICGTSLNTGRVDGSPFVGYAGCARVASLLRRGYGLIAVVRPLVPPLLLLPCFPLGWRNRAVS